MVEKDCSVKISIVTVCFNSAKTIEETIKSVINQSYKNIEYIIIDGGSTDGTLDIIKKYEQYISYWVSEPDKGIYDAMNKGIKIATGDLVAFLNSDDWYFNDTLQRVVEAYLHDGGNIIYGDMAVVNNDGEHIKLLSCKDADFQRILYDTVVYHPCTFIETPILQKRPFDITYRICSDDDLFIDLYLRDYKFTYVGEGGLTHFRLGGCSSTNSLNSNLEVYRIGKKYLRYYINQPLYSVIKRKLRNIIGYVFLLQLEEKLNATFKKKVEKALLRNNIDRIYIFGAGSVGRILATALTKLDIEFEIVDNNSNLFDTVICGKRIKATSNIKAVSGSRVLIANSGDSALMQEQLISMGLEKNRDFYDFYDWCMYILLIKYTRL